MEPYSRTRAGVMLGHDLKGSFLRRAVLRCCFVVAMLCLSQPLFAQQIQIAFGSCASLEYPQPIWSTIADLKPDLFVTLGDIVYSDTEDMTQMREAYAQMDTVVSFKALRSICPVEGIWDDHDYGENDGGASYPKREEVQKIFLDFLGEPKDSPRRASPGIYDVMYLGPDNRIQLILLDTRFFRSQWVKDDVTRMRYRPVYDRDLTMLGDAQWVWLEDQLTRPADVRIIASGVQVVNDGHGYECWGNFPLERDRLFQVIKKTKAEGVLFISGDRHFAELSAMDGGVGYPMYDFTSSGMTHSAIDGIKAPNNKRVGAPFGELNFGVIGVDQNALTLELRDVKGEVRFSHQIELDELRYKTR